jgi:hypothetical protein
MPKPAPAILYSCNFLSTLSVSSVSNATLRWGWGASMSLPKSRWLALTSGERKQLARQIMILLLPILGALALLGSALLIMFT